MNDSLTESIKRHLSHIPGIDAIYLSIANGIVHVYSVAADYTERVYGPLTAQERLIEMDFPAVQFDFHLRAHQGREPAEAVPTESELVFER